MGKLCSAIRCSNTNSKDKRKKGVSFFSFPLKRPEVLNEWVRRIGKEDFKPTAYTYLCSDHFEETDFKYQPFTGLRLLKNGAVPSKFCFTQQIVPPRRLTQEERVELSLQGRSTSLPLTRVKTIMKSSPEVSKISQEAVHLTGKATELFIQALSKFSYEKSKDKATLSYRDLAEVINSEDTLQFLHDIVPRKIKAKEYLQKLRESGALEEN